MIPMYDSNVLSNSFSKYKTFHSHEYEMFLAAAGLKKSPEQEACSLHVTWYSP